MQTLPTVREMKSVVRDLRRAGKRIGFVPTMGALHEGHLSLLRVAHPLADVVICSIFVNPAQFGPHEDFDKYPRTLASDSEKLAVEKTDFLFAPSTEEMYPPGATTYVTVEDLSERLCGRSRPGHFRGVTTIVSKLFNIVQPDVAIFGQKDAAQVSIIRRMVRDLDLGVEIVSAPIIREADGLAMSSRNVYLSAEDRKRGLALHRSLQKVQQSFLEGERDSQRLIKAGEDVLAAEGGVDRDYLEIVDPSDLLPLPQASEGALVAVAAKLGTTRLIDNIILKGSA